MEKVNEESSFCVCTKDMNILSRRHNVVKTSMKKLSKEYLAL